MYGLKNIVCLYETEDNVKCTQFPKANFAVYISSWPRRSTTGDNQQFSDHRSRSGVHKARSVALYMNYLSSISQIIRDIGINFT